MNLKEVLDITECGTKIRVELSPKKLWGNNKHTIISDNKCLIDCYYPLTQYWDYKVIGIMPINNKLLLVIYKGEE